MKNSTFLMVTGGLALLGGVLALLNPFAASLSVGLFAGWILLLIGVLGLASVWQMGGARLWPAVLALMTLVLGVVMIANPMSGLVALTVLVAISLALSGIARIFLARTNQDHPAYWVLLLSGAVSVLLALMIFANFPQAAEVVLGLFLGIELISVGASFLGLGMALRSNGG